MSRLISCSLYPVWRHLTTGTIDTTMTIVTIAGLQKSPLHEALIGLISTTVADLLRSVASAPTLRLVISAISVNDFVVDAGHSCYNLLSTTEVDSNTPKPVTQVNIGSTKDLYHDDRKFWILYNWATWEAIKPLLSKALRTKYHGAASDKWTKLVTLVSRAACTAGVRAHAVNGLALTSGTPTRGLDRPRHARRVSWP